MYPKKSKQLVEEYAQQIGIPAEHLRYMVDVEYKILREIMESMDHNKINVEGLGIFTFRVWKIEPEVKKLNKMLKSTKLPVPALLEMQDKKYKLIKMDEIIMMEQLRRYNAVEMITKMRSVQPDVVVFHDNTGYRNGCRCIICKEAKGQEHKMYLLGKAMKQKREENRIKKLAEYESKKQTTKSLGE